MGTPPPIPADTCGYPQCKASICMVMGAVLAVVGHKSSSVAAEAPHRVAGASLGTTGTQAQTQRHDTLTKAL